MRIKFFINSREPGMTNLAEQMKKVKIDFSSLSTSGSSALWIDGRPSWGFTAVKYAIQNLTKEK